MTRKEARKILFEFVGKFKEHIEDVEKLISDTQEERDELFMSSATSLDNRLKEFHGFTGLDIEYLFGITFKERAIRWIEAHGNKVKQDKLLVPKVKEISVRAEELYAICDRGMNFMYKESKFPNSKVDVTLRPDIKTVHILFDKNGEYLDANMMRAYDIMCKKITNKWSFGNSKDDKDIVLFNNPDAFGNFLAKSEVERKPCIWSLKLKASEIRREFGDSKLTIEDVALLFKKWRYVFFDAEMIPILRNPEKGTWEKVSFASPLFLLIIKESGIASNRWKTQDYKLELRFSTEYPLGWIMIQNLSCGRGGRLTLPLDAYSGKGKLSSYQQNILREIRMWKRLPRYSIMYWGKVAGYKTKKMWRLKELLQKDFSILKSKKHVEDFKIAGRGVKAAIGILK